jgi:hypothetical protein
MIKVHGSTNPSFELNEETCRNIGLKLFENFLKLFKTLCQTEEVR